MVDESLESASKHHPAFLPGGNPAAGTALEVRPGDGNLVLVAAQGQPPIVWFPWINASGPTPNVHASTARQNSVQSCVPGNTL